MHCFHLKKIYQKNRHEEAEDGKTSSFSCVAFILCIRVKWSVNCALCANVQGVAEFREIITSNECKGIPWPIYDAFQVPNKTVEQPSIQRIPTDTDQGLLCTHHYCNGALYCEFVFCCSNLLGNSRSVNGRRVFGCGIGRKSWFWFAAKPQWAAIGWHSWLGAIRMWMMPRIKGHRR